MANRNMSQGADPLKSIFYALFANGSIAIAKGFAAWITGSGAMLAEAIHSVADCSNQLLLLLGIKKAKRHPHPITLWAMARKSIFGHFWWL